MGVQAGMFFRVAPYMPKRRSVLDGTVRYGRVAAAGLLVASAIVLPTSEASARCWHNGWGWRCGPRLLAFPFVAAGAVVAGAAAIATAPVRAIVGPPYYAPPPPIITPRRATTMARRHRGVTPVEADPSRSASTLPSFRKRLRDYETFTPTRSAHDDRLLQPSDGRASAAERRAPRQGRRRRRHKR
jgi:hypothetical protein